MSERTFTRITVDGQSYGSVDDMPPDVRAKYEGAMRLLADGDGNGIPDVLESGAIPPAAGGNVVTRVTSTTSTRQFLNGREVWASPDVDPHLARMLERHLHAAGSGGDGTIRLSWPTLLALLATVAVITAAVVWGWMQS